MNGNQINQSEKKTLTGAERIRKWRKKQNAGYRKSESERIEVIRKARNAEMGVDELNRQRAETAERQRISRAERKRKEKTDRGAGGEAANVPSYHRRQSLTKAINRPDSPRKQKSVVCGLATKLGIELKQKMRNSLLAATNAGLSAEVREAVTHFYYHSDIVYTMPGMNDCMTVWDAGKKSKLQKHYLTLFLREAFACFKDLYAEHRIGFLLFCNLRPKNVLS